MILSNRQERKESSTQIAMIAFWGLAMTMILFCFSSGISGNDFWWHIKVGQWIVDNSSVPKTDIFSWYGIVNNIPWVAHEWLSDVIFYSIYTALGSIGIYAVSLGAAFLLTALLWKEAKAHLAQSVLFGGLFFVLFSVTTSFFFYGRPQLFSFFLLYLEIKILYSFYDNPKGKLIYFIPLLTILWSNLHGGSASISYLLCVVFLIVGVLNCHIGKIESFRLGNKDILKLASVTVLTITAVLVNPVGLDVLVYPYKSLGDQLQMTLISEWRSPDAKNIGDLVLFLCPTALMIISLIATKRKIRLIDVAVMCVFALLFLRSVRFIVFLYISAVFWGFPYLPECRIKPTGTKAEKALLMTCLAACLVIAGVSVVNIYEKTSEDELISVVLSDEAIEAVKEDSPNRIFNDYNLGEALIYNDIPVFFDARADLYAYDNMLADGVSLMYLSPADKNTDDTYVDAELLIKKYDFDAVLILKSRALYSYLVSHPDLYECVYEDSSVGYFRVVQ